MNVPDRLHVLSKRVRLAMAEKKQLESAIADATDRKVVAESRNQNAILAKELVLQVAQKTQGNIGDRISSLVSLALAAVFDNPYTFEVEFVSRRNTTEAQLWFVRDGNKSEPLSCSGGGAIDIASFVLRLALWSLSKTSPIFVLDEPFRNLSLDMQAKAGLMLQELSRKLGVQIIMASHNPEIIAGADRVFFVHSTGKIEQR